MTAGIGRNESVQNSRDECDQITLYTYFFYLQCFYELIIILVLFFKWWLGSFFWFGLFVYLFIYLFILQATFLPVFPL